MLIRHSLTDNTDIFLSNSQVGELDTNFYDQGLYTKSLQSKHVRVGNSLRNLTEFSIYAPGVLTGSSNFALMQFKTIDNQIKLTTTYPFIALTELGNTSLDTSTLEDNQYLGLLADGNFTNKDTPEFSITTLGDIYDLTLDESTHGYVLASVLGTYPSTKDPFISTYQYGWTLKPENSRLLKFDDTRENLPKQTYQVIRAFIPSDNKGIGVENTRLQISYDRAPVLSTELLCNGYSIRNQIYNTQVIDADKALYTVFCDCNKYSMFIIDCTDVNILTIGFGYQTQVITGLVPIGLIINNFDGIIKFSNDVEFENGMPLSLIGSNHILNCLIYNTGSTLKVRVLQKATNISKVAS